MKNVTIFSMLIFTTYLFSACSKEEKLHVDFSNYNPDTYVETDLDRWITSNFTDPYNIEVVYRYERSLHDVGKDIAPVNTQYVMPQMEAVLNVFLKVYESVGGVAFIKKQTPKQIVLYGSNAYNSDGSVTLGTAEGGRKVVLYEVNSFDATDADNVKRRLRTIHHEFTHILNQTVTIPPEFQAITKADYYQDWTNNTENSESIAKNLGFVSRYARSQFSEDFAETVAHLLVEGQLWYDQYANSSNEDAQAKLKRKEALVVDYFKQYFNIDFRELQFEIDSVFKNTYHNTLKSSFPYWLNQEMFSNLTVDMAQGHYTEFGYSPIFKNVYDDFKARMYASYTNRFVMNSIQFLFTSANTITVRVPFNAEAAPGTIYNGDFNFELSVDEETGETVFKKAETEGTGVTFDNGSLFTTDFESTIQKYLTENVFVADWIPANPGLSNFQKFGGFYVKGKPDSYFYGPLIQSIKF